jgi:hypothetical protein
MISQLLKLLKRPDPLVFTDLLEDFQLEVSGREHVVSVFMKDGKFWIKYEVTEHYENKRVSYSANISDEETATSFQWMHDEVMIWFTQRLPNGMVYDLLNGSSD